VCHSGMEIHFIVFLFFLRVPCIHRRSRGRGCFFCFCLSSSLLLLLLLLALPSYTDITILVLVAIMIILVVYRFHLSRECAEENRVAVLVDDVRVALMQLQFTRDSFCNGVYVCVCMCVNTKQSKPSKRTTNTHKQRK
jgi:hypothetical protein